jgi:small-conductance mechanosensitive channel
MKRPGFFEGVGVALVASIAGGLLFTVLATQFTGGFALRAVIAVAALGYLLYLLKRSGERVGRITTLTLWLAAALAIWLLGLSLPLYLVAHLGLIWLVRSLYFHTGPLAAAADLGLVLFGLVAAFWAWLVIGGLGISLWCFFLLQALFVHISAGLPHKTAKHWGSAAETDPFQQAYRTAEAAVAKLSSMR